MNGPTCRIGEREVPLESFSVVLVRGAVVGPAGGSDERRIEVIDRIVGRCRRVRLPGSLGNLSSEVRMERSARVLELADRTPCDVLDDRL